MKPEKEPESELEPRVKQLIGQNYPIIIGISR